MAVVATQRNVFIVSPQITCVDAAGLKDGRRDERLRIRD
jgi:hypothetical protein